jgi:hypothetical protein
MRIQKTGRKRVVIENLKPSIDCGKYPIKRVVGESVTVEANVFGDGHDVVNALVVYRRKSEKKWSSVPMDSLGNDVWRGTFRIESGGGIRVFGRRMDRSLQNLDRRYKEKTRCRSGCQRIDLIAGALMAERGVEKSERSRQGVSLKNMLPVFVTIQI